MLAVFAPVLGASFIAASVYIDNVCVRLGMLSD